MTDWERIGQIEERTIALNDLVDKAYAEGNRDLAWSLLEEAAALDEEKAEVLNG